MTAVEKKTTNLKIIGKIILSHFDNHRRFLPWRQEQKNIQRSYQVWISEIMLQQTKVSTVIPYFNKFMTKWPNILILSKATLSEVLQIWSGLGYYSRARNLHAASKIIVKDFAGNLPDNEKDLMKLPGVGQYTASAILAIAYKKEAIVIDVNVTRIISRLFYIKENNQKKIKMFAKDLMDKNRPGDYSEAIMELGQTICISNKPKCSICPCIKYCISKRLDNIKFPKVITDKKKKVIKYGLVFAIFDEKRNIYIERLPNKGMLGGTLFLPGPQWSKSKDIFNNYKEKFPLKIHWTKHKEEVNYNFSHFTLKLKIFCGNVLDKNKPSGCWVARDSLEKKEISSLMKKVLNLLS